MRGFVVCRAHDAFHDYGSIPSEVRQALKLAPRQRVSYELRPDGSAVIRPVPGLDELFGSLASEKPVASSREEKRAAREAIAREAGGEGIK